MLISRDTLSTNGRMGLSSRFEPESAWARTIWISPAASACAVLIRMLHACEDWRAASICRHVAECIHPSPLCLRAVAPARCLPLIRLRRYALLMQVPHRCRRLCHPWRRRHTAVRAFLRLACSRACLHPSAACLRPASFLLASANLSLNLFVTACSRRYLLAFLAAGSQRVDRNVFNGDHRGRTSA